MKRQRKTPKRFYAYAVCLVLMGYLAVWDGPRPRNIVLSGSPEAMGRRFGKRNRTAIRLLHSLYVKRAVCGSETVYASSCAKAGRAFVRLRPVYQRELLALSRGSGVELDGLMLGNCFLDLGLGSAGCRSLVFHNGRDLYHGHNLDWDSLAGLAAWTVSVVRRSPDDGRFSTVSIAFPGMIGALDIINAHGIALSFNQLGFGSSECEEPVFIMMRRIAETCMTYAEARHQILSAPRGMPFIITLSDAMSGESGVFERVRADVTERRALDGLVTADNVAWGEEVPRSTVERRARQCRVSCTEDVQQAFRHPDIMLACNIYSVIFHFAQDRLYIASGRIPAATHEYRTYPLFCR